MSWLKSKYIMETDDYEMDFARAFADCFTVPVFN